MRLARQFSLAWRIAGNIRGHQAQIVHIHTCSGAIFWRDCLHLLLVRLMGRRAVWHIHGAQFDQFLEATGPVRRQVFRLAMEHASAVLVLSRDWLERLRVYAPKAHWLIVPNGIPVPEQASSPAQPQPCFLFMGDLGGRKGCRDLVRATHLALERGFDGVVHVAGGETEPGQQQQLHQEILDRSAQSHIRLLGSVSGQAKEEALNSADCFVLPSYAEGLPMALLEAMAHGLPSITTRVGGIPEVVRDGQEGFLIEPGDVESLADRMVCLAKDAQLRRKMGQAGRERIGDGYSLEAMVKRLDEVYQELLERNRS